MLQVAFGGRRVPFVAAVRTILKSWRSENELTQEVVAGAAKVTARTVANWERGVGEPGIEQLKALEKLQPGLLMALGLEGKAP